VRPFFLQVDKRTITSDDLSPSNAIIPIQILWSPGVDVEELAIGFFISNYAYYETWYSASYENWIMKLVNENGSIYRGLRAAIQAVGMASISNSSLSTGMTRRAETLYCQALKSMNIALKDPRLVTQDVTLLMVIVLGLFEVSRAHSKQRDMKAHYPCTWLRQLRLESVPNIAVGKVTSMGLLCYWSCEGRSKSTVSGASSYIFRSDPKL